MTLVIDASIAIKWFVEEDGSADAADLLNTEDALLAPDFILIELANIGWKKLRRGEAEARQIEAMISNAGSLLALRPSGPLLRDAYEIARELDHPIYDCLYLACAKAAEANLVTADQRLMNKCRTRAWRDVVSSLPAR